LHLFGFSLWIVLWCMDPRTSSCVLEDSTLPLITLSPPVYKQCITYTLLQLIFSRLFFYMDVVTIQWCCMCVLLFVKGASSESIK
jgi:hypothetical protein